MPTRKINFQRFKEGDPFSTSEIDTRFGQFEKDINQVNDGLDEVAIGEGALNYHHLASSGPATSASYNFGSTLVNATSVRNNPSKHSGTWQIYDGWDRDELWTKGHMGDRWSLHRGGVIGSSRYPSTGGFHSKKMETAIDDVKMGTDYYDLNDPAYSSGILLMFNTYVMTSTDSMTDGACIELQIKCNTGASTVNEWVPIDGSNRWLYGPTGTHGIEASVKMGQPISIRMFLTRQRILSSFGAYNNPDVTKENMIVKGFRAKIGLIGDRASSSTETSVRHGLYLKESTLSALSLRAKKAVG